MKAVVAAFNQEKALVGAFSVIVKTSCGTDGSICGTTQDIPLFCRKTSSCWLWSCGCNWGNSQILDTFQFLMKKVNWLEVIFKTWLCAAVCEDHNAEGGQFIVIMIKTKYPSGHHRSWCASSQRSSEPRWATSYILNAVQSGRSLGGSGSCCSQIFRYLMCNKREVYLICKSTFESFYHLHF